MRQYPKYRRSFGSLVSGVVPAKSGTTGGSTIAQQVAAATPAPVSITDETIAQQAAAASALQAPPVLATAPIVSTPAPQTSLASQAAAVVAANAATAPQQTQVQEAEFAATQTGTIAQAAQMASNSTAAQTADVAAMSVDAQGVALMQANPTLASNANPYLAAGVTDQGAVGSPPSYIPLPQYTPAAGSQNPGTFPYNNPPPHWSTNLKWWTGQTLLNVGTPQFVNDPWEYLRSALVDSNMPMLQAFCQWYLAEVGKPASTQYASAQPWTYALSQIDLAQHKYIQTSEGPVFLPFSYADLTAIQQATANLEYDYDADTLATLLAQWWNSIVPDQSQFDISVRLNPATQTPIKSPYPVCVIPAIFRQGSTFLSANLVMIEIVSFALGAALVAFLVPGSGIAAAASPEMASGGAATAANLASSADVAGGLAADSTASLADDTLSSIDTAGDLQPISFDVESTEISATDAGVSSEVLAPITVSAVAPSSITTGITVAAAAGATATAEVLPEFDVTSATEPTDTDLGEPSVTAADIADIAANLPSINYPTNPAPTVSPQQALSAGSLLSKLLGGAGSAGEGTGETGVTGDLADFFGSLTTGEWLAILAAGVLGVTFIHKSKHRRKKS